MPFGRPVLRLQCRDGVVGCVISKDLVSLADNFQSKTVFEKCYALEANSACKEHFASREAPVWTFYINQLNLYSVVLECRDTSCSGI